MRTLMKRALLGMVTAAAIVGLSTAASANYMYLEWSGGGTSTLSVSTPTATTMSIVVDLKADFSSIGNGSDFVMGSLKVSGGMTPVLCKEVKSQVANPGPTNSVWGVFINGCGAGSPADGGLLGQMGSTVYLIDQNRTGGYGPASSGTVTLGSVTFHLTGALGLHMINIQITPGMGFVGNDAFARAPTSLGNLAVNVIPEPATVALLATGLLGLLGFSRRRKR